MPPNDVTLFLIRQSMAYFTIQRRDKFTITNRTKCKIVFFSVQVSVIPVWHTAGPISYPGKFKEERYIQVQSKVAAVSHVFPMCYSMDLLHG